MIRSGARFVFDLGRVVLSELIEIGSKRLIGLIALAPEIHEEEPVDSLVEVTNEEMVELARQREQMKSRPRPTRVPEDAPPLQPPLEGSLQWRREQARAR